jgi:hypothetical protein
MTIFLKKTETALVLFLTASPIWANPNIPKLAYQCSSGKQDACRELAKIASEDKESLRPEECGGGAERSTASS